jgi:hypothetical protein
LELEDYALTEYNSATADFETENRRLTLTGTPEQRATLIREGEELTSDSALVYSEETGRVWSLGSEAVYQPQAGDPVTSRVMVFDLGEERGSALDATTKYSSGTEWILHGDLTSISDESIYGNRLSFTSCELEEPHYHFAAKDVKIVSGNILVARSVKLYFADVPVAWLPFIAQSTERGRGSGILTPTFSINDIVRTSDRYRRRVSNMGFYWAMSDYSDATVSMDWWSEEFFALTGSLRYNWARQFLAGQLNFRRYWRGEGASELAFDANNNWEISERTRLSLRARYASSSSFVRETSFDPREVVQSIDSDGGLNHRFDWGTVSVSANRRQYLSDDRVEMTLPQANLSLSPVTLFAAPPNQARFFNNITWTGSGNFRRSSSDRPEQPDSAAFTRSLADRVNTTAGFSSSLTMGNFSVSTNMSLKEDLTLGVPQVTDSSGLVDPDASLWMSAFDPANPFLSGTEPGAAIRDETETNLTWSASINYQQRLIGSTTLTPSLQISGRMLRSDLDPLASSFVSAPSRIAFGASLKTDIYGFFPGTGPFDAIRHKITPSLDFSYSPGVTPTAVQDSVFKAREIRTRRELRFGINQTFEAKLKPQAVPAPEGQPEGGEGVPGDSAQVEAGLEGVPPEEGALLPADSLGADSALGPQAQEEAQKVTLLALRTTAVTYDFEEASESGDWLQGFQTTRISNNISSDFLRGLTVSFSHDLFEDVTLTGDAGDTPTKKRKFAPHLSQMNLAFSLNGQSTLVRALGVLFGLGSGDGPVVEVAEEAEEVEEEDPFTTDPLDESRIVPGTSPAREMSGEGGRRSRGQVGDWRLNLGYSLQRPRDENLRSNKMLQSSLSFQPTEMWEVSWRTSYDMIDHSFNDHLIRLTRDLHRWEAHFDFRQTATGNWSFRFEVALTDQEDLHFDYQQRSIQDPSGIRRF